jgi:chromosome segregation ATPase
MDLQKLALGLANLKAGLDDLDRQCTDEAAACMQLRQAVQRSQQSQRELRKEAAAAAAVVHARRDEAQDLEALLQCLQCQHATAETTQHALQVSARGGTRAPAAAAARLNVRACSSVCTG